MKKTKAKKDSDPYAPPPRVKPQRHYDTFALDDFELVIDVASFSSSSSSSSSSD